MIRSIANIASTKSKKQQKSSNHGVQCLTTKRLVDIGQFDGKSIAHSIQIINIEVSNELN